MNCDLPSTQKINEFIGAPLQLLMGPFPTITIDIKKWDAVNSFTQEDCSGFIKLYEGEEKSIVAEITSKASARYAAGYHKALLDGIDNVGLVAEKWEPTEDLAPVKELLVHHRDELKAIMPDFASLGTIGMSEKFFFVFHKNTGSWHLTLDPFDLTSERYSVGFKADAQDRQSNLHADMLLKFKNLDGLVADMTDLYSKVETLANKVVTNPEQKVKPLEADFQSKFMTYINRFGKKDDAGNLEIPINYNDGKWLIGGLTLEEARALTEATWVNLFPKPQQQPEEAPQEDEEEEQQEDEQPQEEVIPG
jgi:hypothetical protein